MHTFIQHLIDFIFPPNPEELKIRSISPEDFIKIAPISSQTEFPFIKSLFSYKDPLVKELIWQIKYKKNKHAIECASYALFKSINSPCLLIPIPISKKRRKERGYNQTELLIDGIIKYDIDNKFQKNFDLLIRNKDIEKQTFKNRNQRIENSRNIFELIGEIDKGQKIVIIDDVSTTGSTLKEAREAMLQAGYINIECLTIAH